MLPQGLPFQSKDCRGVVHFDQRSILLNAGRDDHGLEDEVELVEEDELVELVEEEVEEGEAFRS